MSKRHKDCCWYCIMVEKVDANILRQRKVHDYFNIVCLSVIVPLDLLYLFSATEFDKIGTSQLGIGSEYYYECLLYTFTLYLIADTTWVALVPTCVGASPWAILLHHFLTMILMMVPWFIPQCAWHMAIVLIVEMNTLFLTLKRNTKEGTIAYSMVDNLFMFTWIGFRLILFPILIVFFTKEHFRYGKETNNYWNPIGLGALLLLLLTGMSFHWTIALIKKHYRSKKKE